jgi:hypothetical protein
MLGFSRCAHRTDRARTALREQDVRKRGDEPLRAEGAKLTNEPCCPTGRPFSGAALHAAEYQNVQVALNAGTNGAASAATAS